MSCESIPPELPVGESASILTSESATKATPFKQHKLVLFSLGYLQKVSGFASDGGRFPDS